MTPALVPSAEEVEAQIEAEFADEVRDTINTLDVMLGNLRSRTTDASDVLLTLKRNIHNLRSHAGTVNQPAISLVIHQLDDYASDLKDLSPAQIDDIQHFVDKIGAILDGDIDAHAEDVGAQLVRELPAKKTFEVDFGDITPKNVQIMVIVPEKAMAHIIGREMAACGYRTVNVRKPFDAFEMAIRTKPDMIIAAQELGQISGVDLACAFAAMPKTQNLPFALLTSYSWGHPALERLPPRAALLPKGPQFGEELAAALTRFHIT